MEYIRQGGVIGKDGLPDHAQTAKNNRDKKKLNTDK